MKKISLSTFPYRVNNQGDAFPVIPVTLSSGRMKKEFFALVDSGATVSIFRAEVAESLEIEITKGQEIYLGGVGGRIRGYLHKLKIEVASKMFICPVVFSYEYLVSFNLLGREEFFKRFRIIFEEKRGKLRLE